jgi:hypothetical protein
LSTNPLSWIDAVKNSLAAMIVLASVSASAGAGPAVCPAAAVTLFTCASTPAVGDSVSAAAIFDSIAVCQLQKSTVLTFRLSLAANALPGAQFEGQLQAWVRQQGHSKTYTVLYENQDLTIAVPSRLRSASHRNFKARFTASYDDGPNEASTYSCTRN